jgi:uncharacterized membrane protein
LRLENDTWLGLWNSTKNNVFFIGLNFAALLGFVFWKRIGLKSFFHQYMGLGDILFFIILAIAMPFPAFPLFFVFSLIFALVSGFLFFRNSSVPLAGLQSLALSLFLVYEPHQFAAFNNLLG